MPKVTLETPDNPIRPKYARLTAEDRAVLRMEVLQPNPDWPRILAEYALCNKQAALQALGVKNMEELRSGVIVPPHIKRALAPYRLKLRGNVLYDGKHRKPLDAKTIGRLFCDPVAWCEEYMRGRNTDPGELTPAELIGEAEAVEPNLKTPETIGEAVSFDNLTTW